MVEVRIEDAPSWSAPAVTREALGEGVLAHRGVGQTGLAVGGSERLAGRAAATDLIVKRFPSANRRDLKRQGANDLPRTLHFQPYDLLTTICRDTGGREYGLLRKALARLQSTSVVTNIRAEKTRRKQRQFGWIESWSDLIDEATDQSRGMSITEPRRVSRRLLLLRGWSHDEANPTLFT